jgi:hypothetical protein
MLWQTQYVSIFLAYYYIPEYGRNPAKTIQRKENSMRNPSNEMSQILDERYSI